MIIEKKKIADLKPAPYNPRSSNKRQEQNLKDSLTKFGVVEPIIFNKQTGYIVGGHFRVRELKKLGFKEVEKQKCKQYIAIKVAVIHLRLNKR